MQASVFLALCKQTIVWQPLIGRDPYGAPQYGPVQTFPGRRSFKYSRVASSERGTKGQGAEVISESQIWFLSLDHQVPNVKYEDRVYVSGDAVFPPVVSVEGVPDETGVNQYTKIALGNADG